MQPQAFETIQEVEVELSRLSDAFGGEEAREILDMFLEDSPPRVESLARALEASDGSRAREQAHSLKGAAGNLGAMTLWSVCEGLEREIGEGDWRAARQDLDDLRGRLTAVAEYFGTPGRAD